MICCAKKGHLVGAICCFSNKQFFHGTALFSLNGSGKSSQRILLSNNDLVPEVVHWICSGLMDYVSVERRLTKDRYLVRRGQS